MHKASIAHGVLVFTSRRSVDASKTTTHRQHGQQRRVPRTALLPTVGAAVPASQEVGQRLAAVERRRGATVDKSQRPAVAERRRAAMMSGSSDSEELSTSGGGPSESDMGSASKGLASPQCSVGARSAPSVPALARQRGRQPPDLCGAVVEVEACFSPCQCTVPSSCRIGKGSGSAMFEAKYASACLVSSSSVLSFAMRSSMIFCRQFICKWPGVLQ